MTARPDTSAQMRGAFVGALSGSVSAAAHTWAGGLPPSDEAAVLLLAACAVVGACVSTVRVSRRVLVFDLVALALGQAVGHTALSLTGGGHHHPGSQTAMLFGHVAAVLVTAVLLWSAEVAIGRVVAALVRVVRIVVAAPTGHLRIRIPTPTPRSNLSSWLRAGSTLGVRGPPQLSRLGYTTPF